MRKLSPGSNQSDVNQNDANQNEANQNEASPETLGLLLSHILDNNYTLRSLFADVGTVDSASVCQWLDDKLGEVFLRRADALPLLWSYVWGLEDEADGSSTDQTIPYTKVLECASGEREQDEARAKLALITIRILDIAARSSKANAMLIQSRLPWLSDFLVTRIYGLAPKREFEDTFPARIEWFQNANAEDGPETQPTWVAPSDQLRAAYLSLLRQQLQCGVTTPLTWRLVQLVRKVPPAPAPKPAAIASSGTVTPTTEQEQENESPSRPFRGKTPLKITMPSAPDDKDESLVHEVLDLLKIAMQNQTPSAFILRGARGNAEGGLEIPDLGRVWPNSTKGLIFTAWLNITELNSAITLLELSQKGRKHPLLAVRVLENSQISITTTTYDKDSEPEPEEVICGAPDALIPHGQWVHFAIGCRKGRSTQGGGGEARLFVNGRRVGAVRVAYPVPRPAPREPQHHHNNPQSHLHRRPAPTEGIRASVGRPFPSQDNKDDATTLGQADTNDWMLGRSLMMEEVVSEDLIQLMYRLVSVGASSHSRDRGTTATSKKRWASF